ncbi:MAG: hypothetical protein LBF44_02740 [Holosporaceae bacterium]|nr:hypothetical protein [Holosporaceae bacterium]
MRTSRCFCLALCVFASVVFQETKVFGAESSQENSPKEPNVYVDISQSARENAVSFDGIRGLLGLFFTMQNFEASIGNSKNFTGNNMNQFGLYFGMEYSKSFRKGFLIAVNMETDISKKKKKEGSWKDLNDEYNIQRGQVYLGEKTGKLESDAICPGVALKCGYILPKYESVIFLKLGISKVNGKYYYNSSGAEVCNVNVNTYVPSLGLGVERKINRKWGAAIEANLPIKRSTKNIQDNVEHKMKVGRKDLRLMAIYSISQGK